MLYLTCFGTQSIEFAPKTVKLFLLCFKNISKPHHYGKRITAVDTIAIFRIWWKHTYSWNSTICIDIDPGNQGVHKQVCLWRHALSGHWLSCPGRYHDLLNMKCLLYGLLILQWSTSLGCFHSRTFCWKTDSTRYHGPRLYHAYTLNAG